MTTTGLSPTERVEAGVIFLDRTDPDWWTTNPATGYRIRPSRLNIRLGEQCVGGQRFGDYADALNQWGIDVDQGFALGLDAHYDDGPEVTELWQKIIRRRRRAAKRLAHILGQN